jgi:hypothetical protein
MGSVSISKYYILLFVAIALLSLESCNDSLGIEPNYRRTLIDSVIKPKPVNVKFTADRITVNVAETYSDIRQGVKIYDFPWKLKNNFAEAIIDTNGLIPHLSLRMDFENQYPLDSIPYQINEHVKAIQLITDSIPVSGSYPLNGKIQSGYWSIVVFENVNSYSLTTYEGNFSPLIIVFTENLRTQNEGTIRANLTFDMMIQQQTQKVTITADVEIHYKIE